MSGYAIVQPDLHWLPARGADDGEFSKRDSGAELAIRKVTDNASLGIATSCPTDQRIFSKPSRVSSPTAVKPPTSVRPRTTSSLCRPPTPSRLARRLIQNDAGTSLVQTMETRGHQPIPCSFVPRLRKRHQSATGTTQSNTWISPPRWASGRQRERFALSSETDTMVILPMMVCGRHAGIKRRICASAPGVRTGPRRLPLSSRCA